MDIREKLFLEKIMKDSGPIEILSQMSEFLVKASHFTKSIRETQALHQMRETLDKTAYKILSSLENPREYKPVQRVYSESYHK